MLKFISESGEKNVDEPGFSEVLEAGSVQLPEGPAKAQGKVIESLIVFASFLGKNRHKGKGGGLWKDGVVTCVKGGQILYTSLTEVLHVEETILGLRRQDSL